MQVKMFLEAVEEIWDDFDKDGSGTLSAAEIFDLILMVIDKLGFGDAIDKDNFGDLLEGAQQLKAEAEALKLKIEMEAEAKLKKKRPPPPPAPVIKEQLNMQDTAELINFIVFAGAWKFFKI